MKWKIGRYLKGCCSGVMEMLYRYLHADENREGTTCRIIAIPAENRTKHYRDTRIELYLVISLFSFVIRWTAGRWRLLTVGCASLQISRIRTFIDEYYII
jgi:hypothetical protein